MKIEIVKINTIKINPSNPRLIKDDAFKNLVKSIQDFPEMLQIRPIVVNSDMVVLGGNMRLKACTEAGLKEIPIIIANNLTENQQKEFLIKDNVNGGEWDWDLLDKEWKSEELEVWGLDNNINKEIEQAENGVIIDFQQSVQLIPPKEYILIMCEPNSEEWENMKEWLKLKMVKRGGYKETSTFNSVSIERVLDFKDFKERINANSSTK